MLRRWQRIADPPPENAQNYYLQVNVVDRFGHARTWDLVTWLQHRLRAAVDTSHIAEVSLQTSPSRIRILTSKSPAKTNLQLQGECGNIAARAAGMEVAGKPLTKDGLGLSREDIVGDYSFLRATATEELREGVPGPRFAEWIQRKNDGDHWLTGHEISALIVRWSGASAHRLSREAANSHRL